MNEARRRLLEGSQTFYLGLVGMVLAISLELLVARVQELAELGLSTVEIVVLSVQVLFLLQALIYLWVGWGMGTALLRVVPGYLDAAAPIMVGLFAFVAISWIDPREPLTLLWLAGVVFGSVLAPTARLFARAEAEETNAGVLTGVSGRRMLGWNGATGGLCLLAALAGELTGAVVLVAVLGFAGASVMVAGATLEWLGQARRAAGG